MGLRMKSVVSFLKGNPLVIMTVGFVLLSLSIIAHLSGMFGFQSPIPMVIGVGGVIIYIVGRILVAQSRRNSRRQRPSNDD